MLDMRRSGMMRRSFLIIFSLLSISGKCAGGPNDRRSAAFRRSDLVGPTTTVFLGLLFLKLLKNIAKNSKKLTLKFTAVDQ